MRTRTQIACWWAHRADMVVALGIYLGPDVPELAVAVDGEFSVLPPPMVSGLAAIVELAEAGCEQRVQRLAVSYPASWNPVRVDRLLREARAAKIVVDRYLTSAEAAVRWWMYRHADDRRDGPVLVLERVGDASAPTLVSVAGLHVETMSTSLVEPIMTLEVVSGDHAVALGTALVATL